MRATVPCPYCGEENEIFVDRSAGGRQSYVEDCQICCQPWSVTVMVNEDDVDVMVKTLDD